MVEAKPFHKGRTRGVGTLFTVSKFFLSLSFLHLGGRTTGKYVIPGPMLKRKEIGTPAVFLQRRRGLKAYFR